MLSKFKVNLLLLLSTTTLVGVGFSSWVIIGGTGATEMHKNSDVIVDSVGFSSRYISLDTSKGENNSGRDIFYIRSTGFCDSGGNLTAGIGKIIYYFKLKLNALYADFNKTFKMNSILTYVSDDLDKFDLIKISKKVIFFNVDSTIFTITNQFKYPFGSNYHSISCSSAFTFLDTYIANNSSLPDVNLELIYTFDLSTYKPSVSNQTAEEINNKTPAFKENMYPYLTDSEFKFELGFEEVDE